MMLIPQVSILFFLALSPPQSGLFRLSTSDFQIAAGSQIILDGKAVGTAPCDITLKASVRHKFEINDNGGNGQTFFVTEKVISKSDALKKIPAWFIDPSLLQPDFRDFEALTTGTASSPDLSESIDRAGRNALANFRSGSVNRYGNIRESGTKEKLDSSSSRSYPKLTRGQMDSLGDVNGGKIVVRTLSASASPVFLEFEIQRVGREYRVYVLAGKRRS